MSSNFVNIEPGQLCSTDRGNANGMFSLLKLSKVKLCTEEAISVGHESVISEAWRRVSMQNSLLQNVLLQFSLQSHSQWYKYLFITIIHCN